jgi:PAS domain S-box-containing protein
MAKRLFQAPEARRGVILLAVISAVIIGTGVGQLIELRKAFRNDVLEENLIVAQVAATIAAGDPEAPIAADVITQRLGDIEVPDQGSLRVFNGAGQPVIGAKPGQGWEQHPAVNAALSGRTGTGEFRLPDESGTHLVAYTPVLETGWAVIVDQPATSANPSAFSSFLVRFLVTSATILIGLVAITRILQKLTQSRNQSAAILTSMAEGVVITDAEAIITTINPAMERLLGIAEAEAKGRSVLEVLVLEDADGQELDRAGRPMIRALELRLVVTSRGYELILRGSGNRRIPVTIAAAPVVGPGNRLIGAVEIVRDVSYERKIDQLKSSLISTVSHEFRTPLTMIRGYSELLVGQSLTEANSREAIHQVSVAAERLTRLVEDLLSVSRIEAEELTMRKEIVTVADVISEVVGSFPPPEGNRVEFTVSKDCEQVVADRDWLVQILTNLVSNAIKYSLGGTTVSVDVVRDAENVDFSVTDRGIGMSPQETSQLFEKFFRADRAEVRQTTGTGLGLYIVRNLVEMQGGRIWVKSQSGKGSTFTFTLPRVVVGDQGSGQLDSEQMDQKVLIDQGVEERR